MATVENSLEKMRQLMLQLREGEAPAAGRSGVDLEPIVRRIEARGRRTRPHARRRDRRCGRHPRPRGPASSGSSATSCRMRSTPREAKDKVWLQAVPPQRSGAGRDRRHRHGMSQEYVRTRLFKPFQTTKEAGLGIGAYESYQYVRELGGSIAVDSEPGRGTVMSIAAAAVRAHAGVRSADVERQMNADKPPPLLIVEDDLALQKQIKWSLDRFESVTAADRESALVQCRSHAPAVVTMDLGLPPDPDSVSEGFRLLERAARHRSGHQGDRADGPERSGQRPCARSRSAPTTSSPSRSTPTCSA